MTDPTPSPDAPPQELVRSPLSDGEWHRLHPLTPLLRGGLFLLVVIGIVIANLRDRLVFLFLPWLAPELGDELGDEVREWEGAGDPVDFIVANNLYVLALLSVLAALLVIVAVFYTSWRFHTFRITDDDVEVRSGILFRTQRRAPLDRVQGVNLTRPMIARLLGMAKLEVVGAGTDSNVKLEYLSTANAEGYSAPRGTLRRMVELANADIDPLYEGVVESTEEAIIDSMVANRTMVGRDGATSIALPHEELVEVMRRYGRM